MADSPDSEVHVSPPTSPTSLSPTVASSPNTPSPKVKGRESFRSNLQVLLKKQDNELVKHRDYKKKIEEGDEEAEKVYNNETEDCKEGDDNENESDKVNSSETKKQVKEPKESTKQRKKSTDRKINGEKEGKVKKRKESLREPKEDKVDAKQEKKIKEPKENPKENNEEKFQRTTDKGEETKVLEEEKSKDPEIEPMIESKADEEKSGSQKKEETKEKETKEKDTADKEKDKKTRSETKTGSTNGSSNVTGKNVVTEEKKTENKKSESPKMERKTEAQQDILLSSSSLLSPPSNDEKEKKMEGRKGVTANMADASKPKKHQGILLKKGRSPFSSWKKYYFILDEKQMIYYRSENDFKGLGAAKGSLDLAMLEEIRPKKPGIMKSRFPFCLTRRTLRPINLAAVTSDDRERWMSILRGTQQHPNRLSGSENILNSPTSSIPTEEKAKYATMPGMTVPVHSEGSMTSLSEESISESDEEEPVLIQPKKIKLIGPGIPMQDFSAVKLKKVENSTKKEEKEEVTNVKTGDEEKEFIDGKMFGVKLKKPVVKGVSIESNMKNKEDSTTTEARENTSVKRPNKQPTIPLNKSTLLSHPDIETNRISPESKQKNVVERKKSPSPSIPLSKGVHAFLVKSADEPEPDDSSVSSEVTRVNDVPVCIAETIEIKYNEDLLSLEDTFSVDLVQDEEEKMHSADDDLNMNGNENTEVSDAEKQNETIEMPQVSISIKENSNEEPEYEEFDEEFLQLMQQKNPANVISYENTKTNSEESSPIPKPSSLNENTESEAKDTSLDLEELVYENFDVETHNKNKPLLNEQSEIPPRSQADKTVVVADKPAIIDDEPECEEFDEEFVKKVTAGSKPSTTASSVQVLTIPSGRNTDQEDSVTPPRSPFRLRSGTNESSNSSCRSDSENTDKISGKFKIFQSKHSGSSDENKKEEDSMEGKERKKKKSAFSKFLPSMKSKDKKNKADVEGSKHPQSEDGIIPENPEYSKTKSNEPEKELNSETTNVKCVDKEKQKLPEMDIPLISVQGEPVEKEKSMQVDLRQDPPSFIGEARSSTYSCSSTTSKDRDPPPEVPEKRGTRAKSPGYDVPQSNRPVTTLDYSFQQAEEEEEEEEKQVDGMISQEQINAILTAKDNRERRRKSSSRNSGGLLVVPDSSHTVPSGCEVNDDLGSRRPSYFSITSIESDEPLPKTHFLSDRHSCSSGSFKMSTRSDDSDGSSDTQITPSKASETSSEQETTVVLRPNRLTECRSGGPRVSLTSPEFTVPEEDVPGSPGPDKAAPASKVENALEDSPPEKELDKSPHQEDDEQHDYFPDVGGGIKLRQHSPSRLLQGPLDAGVRTSGIIGLKAYLEENQEEVTTTKSGISRLGHSAAIEKLKRESGEDS